MVTAVLQTNEPVELLGDIALSDPLAAVVLLAGVVILAFTTGFAGYLTVGALVDAVMRPFG